MYRWFALLLLPLVLWGCASPQARAPSQEPQGPPRPQAEYIPPVIASEDPAKLTKLTWQGRHLGGLSSIDGTELQGWASGIAYLRPGKHIVVYRVWVQVRGRDGASFGLCAPKKSEFVGEAGKTYTWEEILTAIDPQAASLADNRDSHDVYLQYTP